MTAVTVSLQHCVLATVLSALQALLCPHNHLSHLKGGTLRYGGVTWLSEPHGQVAASGARPRSVTQPSPSCVGVPDPLRVTPRPQTRCGRWEARCRREAAPACPAAGRPRPPPPTASARDAPAPQLRSSAVPECSRASQTSHSPARMELGRQAPPGRPNPELPRAPAPQTHVRRAQGDTGSGHGAPARITLGPGTTPPGPSLSPASPGPSPSPASLGPSPAPPPQAPPPEAPPWAPPPAPPSPHLHTPRGGEGGHGAQRGGLSWPGLGRGRGHLHSPSVAQNTVRWREAAGGSVLCPGVGGACQPPPCGWSESTGDAWVQGPAALGHPSTAARLLSVQAGTATTSELPASSGPGRAARLVSRSPRGAHGDEAGTGPLPAWRGDGGWWGAAG